MKLLVGGNLFLDNPQLIMLDKDGTLIDIHHYWASMIRLRAKKIGEKWCYYYQSTGGLCVTTDDCIDDHTAKFALIAQL